MTVLINAANLRAGGGVQVASSFLDELASLREDPEVTNAFPWLRSDLHVYASTPVLADTRAESVRALGAVEHNATFSLQARRAPAVDVSFTVFGPEYVPFRSRHRIVGFADVTSLFPERTPSVMRHQTLRRSIRRRVSRQRFLRADTIVTETQTMARALIDRWALPAERVHVVPNATHGVFEHPDSWAPSPLVRNSDMPHVVFVTRGYPHKNLRVIGPVGDILSDAGRPVRFVLTLPEHEWLGLPDSVRSHSTNLGPVSVRQLHNLYQSCDASFFPSLLEAFSVTPLEALRTGTPLVASDRDFVRDIAGAVPYYADPHDPQALAAALIEALDNGRDARVSAGVGDAKSWPTARDRAQAYVQLIDAGLRRA